ncbi:MAG: glycosyltransferase family 39 protein [Nitrospinota bacterium]
MPSLPTFSSNKSSENLIVSIWMIFCFLTLIYKLGEIPPYHADENFYVESSLRMVESGDYITPVYHEKKRFAKPILYYWMVVSSYKVFGVSLASARLPSVVFGTLSIGLVFLLGCRLFDSRVGLFAAFILPSIYLHFQIARWATTDMALGFFILLSFYYFTLLFKSSFQSNTYACLFYIAMGLGFMVKGPPAILIPGLTIIGFLIATKQRSLFAELHLGKGFLILLIIILPWFSAMLLMHGEEFKNHIVGNEIKNRLVHDIPFSFYYFVVLLRYQLPWSIFFLCSFLTQLGFFSYTRKNGMTLAEQVKEFGKNVGKNIKQLFEEVNQPIAFCYLWILVCLILFTLLRIEHSRYMLPGCPPLALIVARMFVEVEKNSGQQKIFGFNFSRITSASLFLIFSVLASIGIFLMGAVSILSFLLPAVGIFAVVSLVLNARVESIQKMVVSMAIALVLIFASISGDVLPFSNKYPMKKFANKLNEEKFKGPIAVYQLGSHRARLGILTGRMVTMVNSPEEVETLAESGRRFYLVIKETEFKKHFSQLNLNITSEDQIRKKSRTKLISFSDLLDVKKMREKINLTETVYFVSNN